MNHALIEAYAAGASRLADSIRGLSARELDSPPAQGWTIRQIVMHLMDSDLIGSDRMKRVIAEENPTIIGYDESAFAARLFYDQLDAATACDIFRDNRRLTSDILRRLPDAAFQRSGMHNERGRLTLADLVRIIIDHLAGHLRFIAEKRRALGNPASAEL